MGMIDSLSAAGLPAPHRAADFREARAQPAASTVSSLRLLRSQNRRSHWTIGRHANQTARGR